MVVERQYVRGHYTKIKHGTISKKYYPVLITSRGEPIRHSQQGMKSAFLALTWAQRWAKRINKRIQGKYPVVHKPEVTRGVRPNIYFTDIG